MEIVKLSQEEADAGCNASYRRYKSMKTPRDAELQFAFDVQGFAALCVNELHMSLDAVRFRTNQLFDMLEKTNAGKKN